MNMRDNIVVDRLGYLHGLPVTRRLYRLPLPRLRTSPPPFTASTACTSHPPSDVNIKHLLGGLGIGRATRDWRWLLS